MGSTLSSLLIEYSCALTPKVMSALLLPLIVLLSWLRSYRFLAPASILGVLALLMSIIVVLVDGFRSEGSVGFLCFLMVFFVQTKVQHHRSDYNISSCFLGHFPALFGKCSILVSDSLGDFADRAVDVASNSVSESCRFLHCPGDGCECGLCVARILFVWGKCARKCDW
jgi:hypothetical protein